MGEEYRETLLKAADISLEDVVEAMSKISDEVRVKLASGPLPYRYDCGVCQAFGAPANSTVHFEDFDEPSMTVWIYHEVPKGKFRHRDENYYGPGANEIYERCLATYRAAGWTGEATDANA